MIENLGHYLTQAEDLIKKNAQDQEQQYVELCLLVIQCLEVNIVYRKVLLLRPLEIKTFLAIKST